MANRNKDGKAAMNDAIEKLRKAVAGGKPVSQGEAREFIMEHVLYALANPEFNAAMLECIPHVEFLDMVVEYRVVFDGEDGTKSILVTNGICESLEITGEELDSAARRNAMRFGNTAETLGGMLRRLLGTAEEEQSGDAAAYVVYGKQPKYGASAMLFPESFAEIAKKLGSDLYILPSSVHEVIAVPAIGDASELKRTVRKVNETCVSPEDVLGNSVYRYSLEKGEITVAA